LIGLNALQFGEMVDLLFSHEPVQPQAVSSRKAVISPA
jgi:hypothetical protein